MRAARILVLVIVVNVLLGVFAAWVVLSPEYAAIDAAVREGRKLPPPAPEAVRAIRARPDWKRAFVTPCGAICRMRTNLILRFYSDDELVRAYLATRCFNSPPWTSIVTKPGVWPSWRIWSSTTPAWTAWRRR